MKRTYRLVSVVMLTVLMAIGFSSCVYESMPDEIPSDQFEDDNITLYIRLGILDGPRTRAEAPAIERMASIRIVLLDMDNDGKVEYNNKINYNDPVIESGFILIPTVRGQKKLFFIANEESVTLEGDDNHPTLTDLIEDYPVNSTGFEEAVNAAYFKLNPGLPLPMTSKYELNAGRPGENNYTFYVVPAATKYTFNITNKREDGASTIKSISIKELADINYVMPHVGQQYRDWTNEDGSKTSLYWIDWLRKASEVTNLPGNEKVPDNYEENQRLGWILDYDLPAGFTHAVHDMFTGQQTLPGAITSEEEPVYETVTFGPYYAPESKNLKDATAVNGPQEYTIMIELTDGTGKTVSLSRELSFVTALFRNTHLVIDVTMEMGYMHIYGEIRDWKDNNVFGSLTEEED